MGAQLSRRQADALKAPSAKCTAAALLRTAIHPEAPAACTHRGSGTWVPAAVASRSARSVLVPSATSCDPALPRICSRGLPGCAAATAGRACRRRRSSEGWAKGAVRCTPCRVRPPASSRPLVASAGGCWAGVGVQGWGGGPAYPFAEPHVSGRSRRWRWQRRYALCAQTAPRAARTAWSCRNPARQAAGMAGRALNVLARMCGNKRQAAGTAGRAKACPAPRTGRAEGQPTCGAEMPSTSGGAALPPLAAARCCSSWCSHQKKKGR